MRIERRGGFSGDRVVGGDRAALLGDLPGGEEPDDPVETGTVEIALRFGDIPLERRLRLEVSFDE